MDKRYIVALGNLVPMVKEGVGFSELERRCKSAFCVKVPQYSFQLFPMCQLQLMRPKQDNKEYCLSFFDVPDSKLANIVKENGLPVSCDDSVAKFQVGPIPPMVYQQDLDAKVAARFSGVPIKTELRVDKMSRQPRRNA